MSKVSIIMPVFNGADFLLSSLQSALKQDISELELICVNDGSTDNSLEVLTEYQKKDSRMVVLSQENKGSGAARNLALSKAKGEFITFLDADDWYPDTNVLSTLYGQAKLYKQKMAGGSFVRYYEDGRIESEFSGVYKAYRFEKEEVINVKDYQFDYGYHRFLYERKMLLDNDIVFPDYLRFQDPPFFLRSLIASETFLAIAKPVYAYRKGHQVVSWDIDKLTGLLAGLLENLTISKMKNMAQLHCLIIDRLEKDFFKIIRDNYRNLAVKYLIYRIIESIDSELMSRKDSSFSIENLKIFKLHSLG